MNQNLLNTIKNMFYYKLQIFNQINLIILLINYLDRKKYEKYVKKIY